MSSTVHIATTNPAGKFTIFPARDYQIIAYTTFMQITSVYFDGGENIDSVNFEFRGDIKFTIKKFKKVFPYARNRERFCVLINEAGQYHILSDDKSSLDDYVKEQEKQRGGSSKKLLARKNKKSSKKSYKTFKH